MEKAKNAISFTVACLQNLLEFIESDMVKEKQWFCGYDKQALKDAQVYLNEYQKIKEVNRNEIRQLENKKEEDKWHFEEFNF